MTQNVALSAACWTTAGSAGPMIGHDLSEFSLIDRITAAAEAGYTGFGLLGDDLKVAEKTVGWTQVRDHLRITGMEHVHIEVLWLPTGPPRQKFDEDCKYLVRAAHFFRPSFVKIAGSLEEEPLDVDLYGEVLASVCDAFAVAGCAVGIEIMPFTIVNSIEKAVAIVDRAGSPNAGLMLDLWHIARGPDNFEEIAALPGHYVIGVELDDGPAEPVGDNLLHEAVHDRKLTGEGEMDVAGFVAAVRASGFKGPWGVEIMSDEHRARSLHDQAHESYRAARKFL
ncbi:sugar phosphate isomerase/epimerase family protein [Mycobacterium spongiae]|uniref:TIM barrel protein n=1 Tax=Mycobacterium spongiae TaxID=886343 RepID=A0A975PX67_9MYCO|nr:TIM barrel protein [Mycobacterium spongiae]QUR67782.1 TIM barrel protein [Mycobacterium spongiae]